MFQRKSSLSSSKNIHKIYDNDDDIELEALRLAALESLQYKKALLKDLSISNLNVNVNHCTSEYDCISSTKSDCNTVFNNKFFTQNNKVFNYIKYINVFNIYY
jgi:hypothetical protein